MGNPRRPFSELSARLLYRALKDVEEAMNDEELKTLRKCQQIPLKSMEFRKSAVAVKDLMVRTVVDLKTAKRWLIARNLMVTVGDPIEVVAEVVAPREVPKPVEVKQKSRTEEMTTRTLPKKGDEIATAMGQ